MQTLKSNDAEGLVGLSRRVAERRFARASRISRCCRRARRAALEGLVDPDELRPAVRDARAAAGSPASETTDQAGRSSLIEAALDLGAIEANGATLPIAEIELELLEGSPEALYALALELDALAPLQLETRSKSARGYALAAGAAAGLAQGGAARRSSRGRHGRRERIRPILRDCLQHWCANEAAALDGRDPEGVHQMRVALRRLRSAFSVFGRLIEPERSAPGSRTRPSGS